MYVIHLLHTSAPKMRKVTTGLHEKILFSWMASFKSKDWFIALLTIEKFHACTLQRVCVNLQSLHDSSGLCTVQKWSLSADIALVYSFFFYQNGQENQHSVSSEQWNIITHLSAPFWKLWDLWITSVFWTRIFSPFCSFTWLSSAMISTFLLFHSGSS